MPFLSVRLTTPHAGFRISTSLVFTAAILAGACFTVGASAQTLKTLAPFNGSDGNLPYTAPLIADAHGNLFGVTIYGGTIGSGVVFEVPNSSGVYASGPTRLYSFGGGNDGANPYGGLMIDTNGNLIGTTLQGGMGGAGIVFELPALSTGGYASSPNILVSFTGDNGAGPYSPLIADGQGDLLGTTVSGPGGGTLYEIANNSGAYGAATVLSYFGANGDPSLSPTGALVADSNGNLFGTTEQGTIFEIAKTGTGYAFAPVTLYSSYGDALSDLTIDANGNLFGTDEEGGTNGMGTIFELAKTNGVYASAPTVLYTFTGADGAYPVGGLLLDGAGNLFGTASEGGSSNFGNAFKLAKTSDGYASTLTILGNFDNAVSGAYPAASLIADAAGNLYGTTMNGGPSNLGTVFQIKGAGFVPVSRFVGVPGTANCKGTSTSALAQTYGGIAPAAPALGYFNLAALQSAIGAHCGN